MQSPSFPQGVARLSNGEMAFGGIWNGGQAYLLCAKHGLEYARRNWPLIRGLNPGAVFIDTTTASPLYECYDPEHPLSRAEDEQYKLEQLNLYRADGMAVGSEEGRDFGVPATDWVETRHAHQAGKSIPLWPLVYHDALVTMRYVKPAGPDPTGQGAANWLADMLWGYALCFAVANPNDWARRREEFAGCLHVDAWHKRIGLDKMMSHRYLTEDGLVERTEFSSGVALAANFSAEPRKVDGTEVAPGDYVVLD